MSPAGGGGDERRREPRAPLTVKVQYGDRSDLVADYTQNISRGGTFVLTQRLLSPGTAIRLVLSFPGLLKPLTVNGTVRWVRPEPAEERGMGVEFDATTLEARQQLDELVDRIAREDPELVARRLSVLIVEDNPHVAELVREGLALGARRVVGEKLTFAVTSAENGRAALDLIAAQRFDVILVDLYMPVMDGAEFMRAVRADARLASTPLVALGAGDRARDDAQRAGADFFLEKPLKLAEILATMQRLAELSP